jgi:hypothetical protein
MEQKYVDSNLKEDYLEPEGEYEEKLQELAEKLGCEDTEKLDALLSLLTKEGFDLSETEITYEKSKFGHFDYSFYVNGKEVELYSEEELRQTMAARVEDDLLLPDYYPSSLIDDCITEDTWSHIEEVQFNYFLDMVLEDFDELDRHYNIEDIIDIEALEEEFPDEEFDEIDIREFVKEHFYDISDDCFIESEMEEIYKSDIMDYDEEFRIFMECVASDKADGWTISDVYDIDAIVDKLFEQGFVGQELNGYDNMIYESEGFYVNIPDNSLKELHEKPIDKSFSKKEALDTIAEILEKNGLPTDSFKIEFIPEKNPKSYNMTWDINYNKLSIDESMLELRKPFIALIGHELVHFEHQDKLNGLGILTKEGKMKSIIHEVRADLDGYNKVKDFISRQDYIDHFDIQRDRTEGNMKNPEKDSYRLGYPCFDKRKELASKHDSFTEDAQKEVKQYFNKPKFDQPKGIKR